MIWLIPIIGIVPPVLKFVEFIVVYFVPSKVTRKRDFKGKQKAVNHLVKLRMMTHEEIAKLRFRRESA